MADDESAARKHPPSEIAKDAEQKIRRENELIGVFNRLREHGDQERDSFWPSRNMERLALQLLGCWQNVLGEVSWARFELAGEGAEWKNSEGVPKELAKLAQTAGVRWPHDEVSAAVDQASKVRHKIAHMLYIVSIDGDTPNQTMTIARLGAPGASRKNNGAPGELSWRDNVWSQQSRQHEVITEEEMREALGQIEWLWKSIRSLSRLRKHIAMTAHLDDDFPIDLSWSSSWWVPFAKQDWFVDPEHPKLGELRARPEQAL